MSLQTWFKGVEYDYFVKPVIFGQQADGVLPRHWLTEKDEHTSPDAWTVYSFANFQVWDARRVISDHPDKASALARAAQLAREDKTRALLKGIPFPT